MKTKTEIISLLSLRQCLKYWEELNHIGDMVFHVVQKIWPIHRHLNTRESRERYATMTGSELASGFQLSRGIENFEQLRKNLETDQDFDPRLFLPRIPKEMRNKFSDRAEYLEACYGQSLNASSFLLPLFIHQWLKGKKICELSQPDNIELIDPSQENYLSFLPYQSFMLQLSRPLTRMLIVGKNSRTCNYGQFLIHRDENILKVLAIPSDIEFLTFDAGQEEALKNVFSLSRNSGINKVEKALANYTQKCGRLIDYLDEFPLERTDILSGKIQVHDLNYVLQELDPLRALRKYLYKDEKISDKESLKQIKDEWSLASLLFIINGLGKLFAQYEAPVEVKLYDLSEVADNIASKEPTPNTDRPTETVLKKEKQKWYEVSPGNITFVTLSKKRGEIRNIKIHTGREMPPHLRRGHYRHYRDENSKITKSVFIRQTTIRKDKIKNGETIHGSLSEYI